MYKSTTFEDTVNKQNEIRALIREGKDEAAVDLFYEANPDRNDGHTSISDEAKFLTIYDKCRSLSAKGEDGEITAIQAILKGILYGHKTDDMGPDIWRSPFGRDPIVDWGESFYPGDSSDIELVFDFLVELKLLFEVHPETFDKPQYYFSYEPEFLMELENGEELVKIYKEDFGFPDLCKQLPVWYTAGICMSSANDSICTCIGTSCAHFKDGSEECFHDIKFNPLLVESYRKNPQPGRKLKPTESDVFIGLPRDK